MNTNLVCSIYRTDDYGVGYRDEILTGYCKGDIWYEFYFGDNCGICIDNVSKIKPYLFPLSSMTEEQINMIPRKNQTNLRFTKTIKQGDISSITADFNLFEIRDIFDWFNKNHFDYRGLIEKGLAIDATGLNIY